MIPSTDMMAAAQTSSIAAAMAPACQFPSASCHQRQKQSIPLFIAIHHPAEAEEHGEAAEPKNKYGEVGGHAERAERAAAFDERHAHAGERQRVERPGGAAVPLGAGVLQPLPGGGGHPRGRLRRASHARERWRKTESGGGLDGLRLTGRPGLLVLDSTCRAYKNFNFAVEFWVWNRVKRILTTAKTLWDFFFLITKTL